MKENNNEQREIVTIDDIARIEMRAGKILSAEKVPDTDKLVRLSVDVGEGAPRQIVSGIAQHYPDAAALIGKTCIFFTNLTPRTIKGLESNGMIMALSSDTAFSLLEVSSDISPGTRVK